MKRPLIIRTNIYDECYLYMNLCLMNFMYVYIIHHTFPSFYNEPFTIAVWNLKIIFKKNKRGSILKEPTKLSPWWSGMGIMMKTNALRKVTRKNLLLLWKKLFIMNGMGKVECIFFSSTVIQWTDTVIEWNNTR